jgi:hypothetical protein
LNFEPPLGIERSEAIERFEQLERLKSGLLPVACCLKPHAYFTKRWNDWNERQ